MSNQIKGLSEVCYEYQNRFCVPMSRGAFNDIKSFLLRGIEDRLIIEAIELAVQRGASWQYAKAILERLEEKGIKRFGLYRVAQELKKLKRQFWFHKEDELMPFAVIFAFRTLPEFKDLDRRIEEFVKEAALNPVDENWLDAICEKD